MSRVKRPRREFKKMWDIETLYRWKGWLSVGKVEELLRISLRTDPTKSFLYSIFGQDMHWLFHHSFIFLILLSSVPEFWIVFLSFGFSSEKLLDVNFSFVWVSVSNQCCLFFFVCFTSWNHEFFLFLLYFFWLILLYDVCCF